MARWLSIAICCGAVIGCRAKSIQLEGLPCAEGQKCLEGYVCHPLNNVCVRPAQINCDNNACAAIATGDACSQVGSFVPCDDNGSVRTCLGTAGWTACANCPGDRDHDLVADCVDNCEDVANPDQTNTDGDEFGDACDPEPASGPNFDGRLGWSGGGIMTDSATGYAVQGRMNWHVGKAQP